MSEPPVPPPPEPQLEATPVADDRKRTTLADSPGAAKRRRRPTADPLAMEILAELPRSPDVTRDEATPDALTDSTATAPHQPLPLTPSVAGVPNMPASVPTPITTTTTTTTTTSEDVFLPTSARPRSTVYALGAAILLAGGVAAGLFMQASAGTAPPPAPAQGTLSAVRRGDDALATHRIERFEEAIAAYTEALASYPDDPHILSSLSRVYAVWAAWLQFQVRDLRASGQGTPAQITELLDKTRGLIENAKRHGERAAQRNPGNEEAGVALSDALRLSGNLVAARAELDRARATQGAASAETSRVAAMLAIDEADTGPRAGRSHAEQAVAADPTLLRARLLLARCLFDDNQPALAEAQLAAVREIDPSHPLIAEMSAAAEAARKKAQARPSTADAGLATHSAAPIAQATPPAPAAAPTPAPAPAATPAPAPAPAAPAPARAASDADSSDPLELVRRGEAALERGAVPAAQRAFDRALALDPRSARAKTGLGYVALERNQPIIAISHFRVAAARDHADALIGLGDAYRKLGRTKDALEAYRSYLKRFPKGDRRSIAQRQSELLAEQLEDNR